MRKIVTLLSMAVALSWLPVSAEETQIDSFDTEAPESADEQTSALDRAFVKISEVTPHSPAAKAPSNTLYRGAKVKTIASTSDLAGDYVLSYESYSSEYDGGNLVEISAISGTDSILIDGFFGYDVKAKADISAMTISIPYQYLYTDQTYGDIYLVSWLFDADSTATISTSEITGTISADGAITLNTGWGTADATSTYTNGLNYPGSTIEEVNGKMTYTTYSTSTGTTTTTTVKVVVAQDGDTVYVKNFYDKGTTIAIELYASKSASISEQYVYINSTYDVPVYVRGITFNDDYSTGSTFTPLICNTATDSRTISWGTWTLRYTYNNSGYYSIRGLDGKIEADFDITYPSGSSLSLSGDGSADSPYLIASAADWNALAEYMSTNYAPMDGKYIKLTADIDFTDTAATTFGSVTSFMGDLDGNGKTITLSGTSSADYSGGLITTAADGACIHDLTVAGAYTSSNKYCGAVVGTLTKATLSNITLSATVAASGTYSGGLVGSVNYGTVKDCVFAGTFSGSAQEDGGLVGYAYRSTVSGCVNKGSVSHTKTYAGGIVGYAAYYTEVTNCYNDTVGTVSGTGNLGGVVGLMNYYANVNHCYNYGTVTASSTYSGGVVGYASSTYPEISNCYNYGTMSTSGASNGGVIGLASTTATVTDCGNYGTVIYTGTTVNHYLGGVIGRAFPGTYTNLFNVGTVSSELSTGKYIGGVFGYLYTSASNTSTYTITGCYNTGDITGASYVAGIAADAAQYSYTIMSDCYNTGNITATSTTVATAAGVMGLYPKGSTFTNCWNTGTITSAGGSSVGGVFATRKSTNTSAYPVAFSKCHNSGTINAASTYVGGVIGNLYTSYTTVDSCYNTGSVYSTKNYVGGVIGGLTGSYEIISNSWNVGSVTSATYGVGGIIGHNNTNAGDTIINCFNTGDISTTSSTTTTGYYIGGIVGNSGSVYINTYNTGTITGANYVAGIVGNPITDATKISGAYSTGKIVPLADNTTYGYIVSFDTSDATQWSSANSLSNAYYLAANASESAQPDSYSVAKTYAELAALDMGDGWTPGDNYTYPRLATLADNDYAKAYAAAVVPGVETDTYGAMTGVFYLGAPDGVTWTADNSVISYDGQMGYFNADYQGGTITMTATVGDATATTALTYGVTTGVNGLEADTEAEVVSETLYNTAGQVVAQPANGIYIVRRVYSDGTVTTAKEAR